MSFTGLLFRFVLVRLCVVVVAVGCFVCRQNFGSDGVGRVPAAGGRCGLRHPGEQFKHVFCSPGGGERGMTSRRASNGNSMWPATACTSG